MSLRISLCRAVAVLAAAGLPRMLAAQEQNPVQRVANIVTVAVEEYGKGIDKQGRLISADEYQEAVDFLKDARASAARLPRDRAVPASALLDSIIAAVNAKRPPNELEALNKHFGAVLGSEAALELPRRPLDIAEGQKLYESNCASCHGVRGMGDGPSAAGLNPKPPAIGDPAAMRHAGVTRLIHGHTHQMLSNQIGNISFHGMLSTAWPWPYAPSGLPKLTIQQNRADPFSQFDGCGDGRFQVSTAGLVDQLYNLWDRDPVTVRASYLKSNGAKDQPAATRLPSY